MYIIPDLEEEIFLRLPLKSILKFKTLSKKWRTTLESKMFTERRMKIQKKRKILAAGDGDKDRRKPRFSGDGEEMEMVYLHCNDATRPSLTCDGLVCIPVQGWINVLNPSTGEFLRFPSSSNPVTNSGIWWITSPWPWAMGFGKDKVNGNYKIVRMFRYCEVLDLNIGEWRRLSTPPPYHVDAKRKSTCVNGSIYWLELVNSYNVLALDLHTEEFRNISLPLPKKYALSDQVVNLEDRLALVRSNWLGDWKLEILILDAKEEQWSMTYSINLESFATPPKDKVLFRPLVVSKKGNLFLCDSKKRLFKYYPETNFVRCISQDVCVISPFVENLVSLHPRYSLPDTFGYRSGLRYLEKTPSSRRSKILRETELKILLTTTLVASFVIFRIVSCLRCYYDVKRK